MLKYVQNPVMLDGYASYLVYDGKDQLGAIETTPAMKSKFRITHIGREHSFSINNPFKNTGDKFETKEQAGYVLWAIHQGIKANPLSEELNLFFQQEWRKLHDEREFALNQIRSIQYKRHSFATLAKKYGLKFTHTDDLKAEVSDLVEFLSKENKALYEHLGKDFARTLRGLVASVVRLVDPESADRI